MKLFLGSLVIVAVFAVIAVSTTTYSNVGSAETATVAANDGLFKIPADAGVDVL